jgi:peptidoglycan hydrolase-like protein with peptidoglycan-binding domain
MYKAFASYLKHDRLKETGIGLSLLSLLVAYGEPNPIDGTKEVEDIEMKTKTLDEIIKNKQIVKVGDKGDVVKEIQQLLIDLGFSVGSKGVDGKFGADTKKGVMDFQSDNNIDDDGIVGPITAQKMLDTIKFDEKEYEDIDLEDFVIAKK